MANDDQAATALLAQQAQYHHHKETMAYTAAAVYLAASAAVLGAAQLPAYSRSIQGLVLVAAIATAVGGWIYVLWQLTRRRRAASNVSAIFNHLRGRLPNDVAARIATASEPSRSG